jgi:hypothetical protein
MAGEAAQHIPDEHRLLTGKRRSKRVPRQIDVRLTGKSGDKFQARTIDISRGGMLVELTDPAFAASGAEGAAGDGGGAGFVALAMHVSSEFADGIKVHFGALRVRSRAQVVRLVTRIQDMAFLLGCRFTSDLTPTECRLLGLDTELDETQVDAVLSVPLHADAPQPPPPRTPAPAGGKNVQKPGHPLSPGQAKGR